MFGLDSYTGIIVGGLQQTLLVGISAMVLALIIGISAALAKRSSILILKYIISFYTATIRGIPELILLLMFFYGLPTLVQDVALGLGYDIILNFNPFVAGIFTLAFIYGAFSTEVFRGALDSVPKGQIEAARAMGMTHSQTFFRVQLPQLIRFAIPGISNVWMLLIKATALVSIIQLDDVMRMSKVAANATQKPFTVYLFAAFIYLLITLLSSFLQKYMEKRYSVEYG